MKRDPTTWVILALTVLIVSHGMLMIWAYDRGAAEAEGSLSLSNEYRQALAQCVEAAEMSREFVRAYDEVLAERMERRRRLNPPTWAHLVDDS